MLECLEGLCLGVVRIFAYGSLMYEPELAEEIIGREWVRLSGHRRAFNKWSVVRGCHPSAARWPEIEVPPFFCTERLNRSLVLGTEPGGEIVGINLVYPELAASELLRRYDRREGFYPKRNPAASGYLRRLVSVLRLDTGEASQAWTYLRNPASDFYRPGLEPETVVRVLARATPGQQSTKKVKGIGYFLNIAQVLRQHQVADAYVEALCSVIEREAGAWASELRAQLRDD